MDLKHAPSRPGPPPAGGQRRVSDGVTALMRLVAEGRLGPDLAITCQGRTDGAGMHATATIAAMALARLTGCRYLHSPFDRVAHVEGTPEDWAQRWERFLSLGDQESPVPIDAELVELHDAVRDPDAYRGRPIVIAARAFHVPRPLLVPQLDVLRGALRARYWRSPKGAIPSHRAAEGLTAAFHLRRGDVSAMQNHERYIRDEVGLRHIAQLREALAPFGRPLTVNLYSEGDAADFRAFAEAGCNLHISADAFETFHNMVTADILVAGRSSFSSIAGLLSEGVVVDHRRHPPQPADWARRRARGDISIKRLRQVLLRRCGWLERCAYRIRRWRDRGSRHGSAGAA